jgi:hypothetical protein
MVLFKKSLHEQFETSKELKELFDSSTENHFNQINHWFELAFIRVAPRGTAGANCAFRKGICSREEPARTCRGAMPDRVAAKDGVPIPHRNDPTKP